MKRLHLSRSGLIGVVLISLLGGGFTSASAETSATTKASVNVTNVGRLDVHWANPDTEFLDNGEIPGVSASQPANATAVFQLVIDDSRTDETRSGFTINIASGPFRIDNSSSFISPSQVILSSVSGVPEGSISPAIAGSTLDEPTSVLIVPDHASAVSAILNIEIAMVIPPGTLSGTYSGRIMIDVIPLTSQ